MSRRPCVESIDSAPPGHVDPARRAARRERRRGGRGVCGHRVDPRGSSGAAAGAAARGGLPRVRDRGREAGGRGPRGRGVVAAPRDASCTTNARGSPRCRPRWRGSAARSQQVRRSAPGSPRRASGCRRSWPRPGSSPGAAMRGASRSRQRLPGWQPPRQSLVLAPKLDEARVLLEETTQHAQDLREHYQNLREMRISGMAAELATGLTAGCSCPVCGSAQHPSPAIDAGRVSRADEEAARQRHETADFERQAVKDSVTGLQTQLESARSHCQDLDLADWEHTHDDGDCRAGAEPRRRLSPGSARDRAHCRRRSRQRRWQPRWPAHAPRLEARVQLQAESERRCQGLAAELRELLSAHPEADSVAALVERHTEAQEILEEALRGTDRARARRPRAARGDGRCRSGGRGRRVHVSRRGTGRRAPGWRGGCPFLRPRDQTGHARGRHRESSRRRRSPTPLRSRPPT